MLKNYIKNWKKINNDIIVDVAQRKLSNIKCYASNFSNIYKIDLRIYNRHLNFEAKLLYILLIASENEVLRHKTVI